MGYKYIEVSSKYSDTPPNRSQAIAVGIKANSQGSFVEIMQDIASNICKEYIKNNIKSNIGVLSVFFMFFFMCNATWVSHEVYL
jgi:hypothetical protein